MNADARSAMYDVMSEVTAERERQMDVHGWTPEHDDSHSAQAWGWLVGRRAVDLCAPDDIGGIVNQRRTLLEVAAIAVAAIESFDRKHGDPTQRPDWPIATCPVCGRACSAVPVPVPTPADSDLEQVPVIPGPFRCVQQSESFHRSVWDETRLKASHNAEARAECSSWGEL